MRSLLGRFHRPFARGVDEQLLLLNNLGDGSTLSLDFTTGVLDPRLTFTRSTNATFINSQGLVEWANSNMYWNTAFEGLSGSNPSLTSSGWGYALSTGGTAVFNGDGSVTVTTTAAERRAIFRSSGFSGGGLRVVASVDVTIASGSLQASQVIVTGTPTNAQHYVNGVIWNSSHPIWNGGILPVGTQFNIAYATDSLTSGTTSMYFGVGCSSVIAGSATFSNPRWTMWKGSGTVPYYPNTSATNNSTADRYKSADYQAPRFDYDPSTTPPQPRGLLIEGSANNLVKYSQDLNQVSGVNQWYGAAFNTPTIPGSPPTDPFGGTTASWKLVATAGSAFHLWRFSAAFTAADYTFSFWARAAEYDRIVLSDVGTGRGACTFVLTGSGTATVIAGTVTPTNPRITQHPNGWYRCEVTMTMTAATYGLGIGGYPTATTPTAFGASYNADGTSGVFATAVQVELGSGASSYIPTGASTGNRAYDHCYTTGTNFTSWFSTGAGTVVAVSDNTKNNTQNLNATISDDSTSNYVRMGFKVGGSSNEYLLTTVGGPAAFQGAADSVYVPALNTVYKMAYAWDTNNFAIVANGGTVATDTSGTLAGAGVLTRMVIGGDFVAIPNDIYFKNGHIRSLKYYPTRLPNAQLQALTT